MTGIVDHRAIRASFLTIRLAFSPEVGKKKSDSVTPRPPEEVYRRLDVERQVLDSSGAWSDWQPVDFEQNFRVLDNLPEVDFEQTPEQIRCAALADPLPFLKEGKWSGTDAERFVVAGPPDKEQRVPFSNRKIAGERKNRAARVDAAQPRFHGSAGPDVSLSRPADLSDGESSRYPWALEPTDRAGDDSVTGPPMARRASIASATQRDRLDHSDGRPGEIAADGQQVAGDAR